MKSLVDKILDSRLVCASELEGFKSDKSFPGTSNICECSDDGGDGCSE